MLEADLGPGGGDCLAKAPALLPFADLSAGCEGGKLQAKLTPLSGQGVLTMRLAWVSSSNSYFSIALLVITAKLEVALLTELGRVVVACRMPSLRASV